MKLTGYETDITPYFIRPNKEDRVLIPNNVKIVVGSQSFNCNGCVLANNSKVFSDIIQTQDEIYLDGFVDCLEGVLDAIDLLYGGEVELTMDNIQAIVKFSLIYDISEILDDCMEWVEDQLSLSNLFTFCKMGLLMLSINDARDEVLTYCKDFIQTITADTLLKESEIWAEDESVMKFLIDEELLHVTLPTVTPVTESQD